MRQHAERVQRAKDVAELAELPKHVINPNNAKLRGFRQVEKTFEPFESYPAEPAVIQVALDLRSWFGGDLPTASGGGD